MFHWQLVVLFILFITTTAISWPTDNDNLKMCLHFTGAYGGDARCFAYCRGKGKAGGSCVKKRCVCSGGESEEDSSKERKPIKDLSSSSEKSNDNCEIDLLKCRLNCKNRQDSYGSCINGVCVCSKL